MADPPSLREASKEPLQGSPEGHDVGIPAITGTTKAG